MHTNEEFERFMAQQFQPGDENDMGAKGQQSPTTPPTPGLSVQGGPSNSPNTNATDMSSQFMSTITMLMQQNSQMLSMLQLSQQQAPSFTNPNVNQVPNFNIMPDLSKSIDVFDGEKGPEVASAWLSQLRSMSLIHRWPDAFLLQTARNNLKGAARYWLQGKNEELTSWDLFETAFKKTFMFEISKSDNWRKMQSRHQLPTENVSVYFHSKVALCKVLGLTFMETKEQVAVGLHSRDLSNFIMSKHHDDEDNLFRDIVSYERVVNARRVRQGDRTKEQTSLANTEGVLSNKPPRKAGSHVRCYNCNTPGHVVSECRKPLRPKGSCFTCGATTHQVKDCPANNPRPARGDRTALMVQERPVPAMMVNVQLSKNSFKVSVEAIIDTGSPISLICHSLVKSVDLLPETRFDKVYEGLNQSKLNILDTLKVLLKVCEVEVELYFKVVPDYTMFNKCLLGRDFLALEQLSFVIKGNQILITPNNVDSQVYPSNEIEQETLNILNISYVNPQEVCLDINPELHLNQKLEIEDVMKKSYFEPNRPLEPAIKFQMKIVVNPQHAPFYFKPRRLSYGEKLAVKDILNDLETNNIIQKSNSEYSSPIVLIRKKTKDLRLCVDYRFLNKITLRDNYPMPVIEDQVEGLRSKRYFTILDLKSAFYHVDIEPSSIKYTSFVCLDQQWEFLKMPFGLRNSPSDI